MIDAAVSCQSDFFYGAYWGDLTRFALLDVDAGSRYHNVQELLRLRQNLSTCGLDATALYQSSRSTGWHLYIPFEDWADSGDVERTLKQWLKAKGYDLRGGQLEVFPSGNALRLPLQPGFAWLDDHGVIKLRREELNTEQAVELFLNDLGKNARDWLTSKRLINTELESIRVSAEGVALAHEKAISNDGFADLFNYRAIPEKCEMARKYWVEGLTGKGQRHDAIYSLQHLLWFGDAALGVPKLAGARNNERRYEFLLNWLQRNHNGYCKHINSGQWQAVEQHIRRVCEWRGDHTTPVERTPYKNTERLQLVCEGQTKKTGRLFTPADAERANIRREQGAREKIQAAVQELLPEGRRPRLRLLMRLTGCHQHTIERHSDIWKVSPVVALSSVAGHLDLGGAGGGGASLSFGSISEKESFLNPLLVGDSDLGPAKEIICSDRESLDEQEQAALQAVAPPSPPIATACMRLVADEAEQPCELAPISLWCLTPYAETLRGDGEQLNGKRHLRLLPPSDPASLATGSSTGALTCKLEPVRICGLNGFPPTRCAGPSHLNPRDFYMALCARSWRRSEGIEQPIFYKGARALNLTAREERRECSRAPPGVD
jgi:hypothetical protein